MERHNPLLDPRPDDPIEEVHAYARDLAYLVLQYEWRFGWGLPHYHQLHDGTIMGKNHQTFLEKWGKGSLEDEKTPIRPNYATLESLEYIKTRLNSNNALNYLLTSKAFQLLDKPIQPPFIFISYRRMESSAFALLIESRLRFVGIPNVFIDKNIDAGTQWEQEIEAQVRQCKTFIVLIGSETLKSPMVRKEIQWAEEQGARIIPIWHNGHSLEDEKDCPPIVSSSNDIRVEGLAAKHYETAINELLNTLGYRTY